MNSVLQSVRGINCQFIFFLMTFTLLKDELSTIVKAVDINSFLSLQVMGNQIALCHDQYHDEQMAK